MPRVLESKVLQPGVSGIRLGGSWGLVWEEEGEEQEEDGGEEEG